MEGAEIMSDTAMVVGMHTMTALWSRNLHQASITSMCVVGISMSVVFMYSTGLWVHW